MKYKKELVKATHQKRAQEIKGAEIDNSSRG